jgi:S-adenosyl-l-methionine hydroxide adenosyltransferase
MFVTIINDCKDPNAFGRQGTKAAALLGAPVTLVGVNSDLEAAGNLVDVLAAGEGAKGVVLVNVAPRNGAAKKWPNGTPFGWFTYGDTLVVASIDGLTLSLVKKLGIAKEINVFDIPTVMDAVAAQDLIDKDTAEYVKSTQFRSLEFIPRAAAWLVKGWKLPAKPLSIADIADAPAAVWWVDNFGNCKTTLLPEELGEFIDDESFSGLASLQLHDRLKDVSNGDASFVIGSSGMPGRRFIEVMVQGDSAAKRFGLSAGSSLRAEPMTAHEEALAAVMR